jgi:hypothetical protein
LALGISSLSVFGLREPASQSPSSRRKKLVSQEVPLPSFEVFAGIPGRNCFESHSRVQGMVEKQAPAGISRPARVVRVQAALLR